MIKKILKIFLVIMIMITSIKLYQLNVAAYYINYVYFYTRNSDGTLTNSTYTANGNSKYISKYYTVVENYISSLNLPANEPVNITIKGSHDDNFTVKSIDSFKFGNEYFNDGTVVTYSSYELIVNDDNTFEIKLNGVVSNKQLNLLGYYLEIETASTGISSLFKFDEVIIEEPPKAPLSTPSISLKNNHLIIDNVDNATSYFIRLDDIDVGYEVNKVYGYTTEVELKQYEYFQEGETYSLNVYAIASGYENSDISNTVTYIPKYKYDTPILSIKDNEYLIADNCLVECDYEFYIDDVLIHTKDNDAIENCQLKWWLPNYIEDDNQHTFKVRAVYEETGYYEYDNYKLEDSDFATITFNKTSIKLDKPTISLNGDLLTINNVLNNAWYYIYSNNTYLTKYDGAIADNGTIKDIFITQYLKTVGSNSIYVVAVPYDTWIYSNSDNSNYVNFYYKFESLSKPILSINGNYLNINNCVADASYGLYINEELVDTFSLENVSDTSIVDINLLNYVNKEGTYSIKVIAEPHNNYYYSATESDIISYNYSKIKVNTPTITISGDFITISNCVEDADYELYINNEVVESFPSDAIKNGKIADIWIPGYLSDNGSYNIKVIAKPYDTKTYKNSDDSNVVTYKYNFDLSQPSIAITDNILRIANQSNVDAYQIYIVETDEVFTVSKSSIEVTTYDLNNLGLKNGDYNVFVVSINALEQSTPSNTLGFTINVVEDDDNDDNETPIVSNTYDYEFIPWKVKYITWDANNFEGTYVKQPNLSYGMDIREGNYAVTQVYIYYDIPTLETGKTLILDTSFEISGFKWEEFSVEGYGIVAEQENIELDRTDFAGYISDWNIMGNGKIKLVNNSNKNIETLYIKYTCHTGANIKFALAMMNKSSASITKTTEELEKEKQDNILNFVADIPNIPNKVATLVNTKIDDLKTTTETVGTNIKTAVDNIGTKISDTIDTMKTAVTESVNGIGTAITGAINQIETWLTNLLNGIINGLKNLFVPTEEYFNNYFDELYEFFSNKLGILMMPFDILINLFERYLNLGNGDGFIHIPEFKFMNMTLIPKYDYNLKNDIQQVFGSYLDIYYLVVDVIIYFMMFNMAKKKFESIVGGN